MKMRILLIVVLIGLIVPAKFVFSEKTEEEETAINKTVKNEVSEEIKEDSREKEEKKSSQEEVKDAIEQKTNNNEVGNIDGTTITCSGPLDFDYEKRIAFFHENVVVEDSKMKMNADEMTVHFNTDGESLEMVVATGSVKFKKGDRRAKSQKAVYTAADGTIVLTGEPMVKKGPDILTAEKITFFRNDNRMICEPSARLVIYSKEHEGDDEWF